MVKKTVVLVFGFLMLSSAMYSQEAKFKALFMYNFTKYLEWPSEKQKGDFIIGVYGSSDITRELKIISEKKRVGTQLIKVVEVNSDSEISTCNILFLPENKSSQVTKIVSQCTGNGTVLITDKPGMAATAAGINYIKIDGRQSFEISKLNLEKQGVKVNSVLLSLGVVVN